MKGSCIWQTDTRTHIIVNIFVWKKKSTFPNNWFSLTAFSLWFFQQLEALEKIIVPLQNGILRARGIIDRMEEGAEKTAAQGALAEFRKSDERACSQTSIFFANLEETWTRNSCKICQKKERRIFGQRFSKNIGGQGQVGVKTWTWPWVN